MNNKLLIQAYKKIDYAEGDFLGKLFVQINPESYKLNKSVQFAENEKIGNAAHTPGFKEFKPSSLSFDIIFDGTGVIPTWGKTVTERIEELDNLVYRMVGDTREPAYVKIDWGELSFNGRLNKSDYSYTLFTPNGAPLRAKVSLTFTEALSVEEEQKIKQQAEAKGEYKTFKENDSLLALCKEKYKSSNYAALIANLNNLDGFRDIKAGTKIWFPDE